MINDNADNDNKDNNNNNNNKNHDMIIRSRRRWIRDYVYGTRQYKYLV